MEKSKCKISRWQLIKKELNNLESADFLESFYRHPDAILIDVRTAEEYGAHHLDGAINIDYLSPDFWDCMEQLDMERTYFVYCRSERRSIRACRLMQNGGFKKVFNLSWGLRSMDKVS
jgi:rhodanese-related sulfurtransferase